MQKISTKLCGLSPNNNASSTSPDESSINNITKKACITGEKPVYNASNSNPPLLKDSLIIPTNSIISNVVNESYNKKTRLSRLRLQTETINESQLIDGRFIPAPLLDKIIESSGKSVVILAAGLGLGKSTAASQLMMDSSNGLGVAISHRVKLTSQLCSSFAAMNYEEVKKIEEGQTIERLGTTVQSVAMMIDNPFCKAAFNGGLLVIDESNSVASDFTGKTIRNEAATMATLKKAIKKAKITLCLDAHADESTVSMLEAAGVKRSKILLIEVKKPELKGYTVNVFEDEQDEKGKSTLRPALMNQIILDLKIGKKVIVVSLSAKFLDALERRIKKAGLFGSIKITSETKRAVFDSLTPDTYGDYLLVMLSPAMSTGISFDKDNADECYVWLSNNDGTGSYQDGLQAMLRDRYIKSKTINVFYEEGKKPLTSVDQAMIYKDRQITALENFISDNPELAKAFNQVRPNSEGVNEFIWGERIKQVKEKRVFLPLFLDECRSKGADIKYKSIDDLADGDITAEILSSDKKEVRETFVQAIIDADKLTDDIDLNADIDTDPMKEREKIEKFAAINFDETSDTEKLEFINKIVPDDGKGSCIPRIRAFERSFTPVAQIKKTVEIAIIGARNDEGDRVNFAEKITTSKLHSVNTAHFTSKALKACGIVDIDGQLQIKDMPPLNEASAKSNPDYKSLYMALKKAPEKAIISGMLGATIKQSDAKKVKEAPFSYMVTLLNNLGIKLRKSRGLEQYVVDADSLFFDVDMINRRRIAGINEAKEWLDQIQEYLDNHKVRQAQKQNLEAAVTEKAPDTVVGAISKALDKIDQIDLLNDALVYLEPFHSRIEKGMLSMINIELIVNRYVDTQV